MPVVWPAAVTNGPVPVAALTGTVDGETVSADAIVLVSPTDEGTCWVLVGPGTPSPAICSTMYPAGSENSGREMRSGPPPAVPVAVTLAPDRKAAVKLASAPSVVGAPGKEGRVELAVTGSTSPLGIGTVVVAVLEEKEEDEVVSATSTTLLAFKDTEEPVVAFKMTPGVDADGGSVAAATSSAAVAGLFSGRRTTVDGGAVIAVETDIVVVGSVVVVVVAAGVDEGRLADEPDKVGCNETRHLNYQPNDRYSQNKIDKLHSLIGCLLFFSS